MTATLPHTDWLLEAHLSDGSVLEVTEDHLFWSVTGTAWVELQDLDTTDVLLTPDGATVTVDWLDWDAGVDAPAWDLTVEGEHNFFVAADDTAEPVLVHNAGGGLFCGVVVDADFAVALRRLDVSLASEGLSDAAGANLGNLFGNLSTFQQEEFLGTLASLQQRVANPNELAQRASRMIETAAENPNWTKDLLEDAGTGSKFELHMDQIARNGSDAGGEVLDSARTGRALSDRPTSLSDADRAEAFSSEFHVNRNSTVENLNEAIDPPERFVNIHGDVPPRPEAKPDQLVDGEFRDTFNPLPTTSNEDMVKTGFEKIQDGQTQRVDIVLPPDKSLQDALDGFAQLRSRFDGPEPTFLQQFSFTDPARDRTFLPIEVRAIDAAGDSVTLFP